MRETFFENQFGLQPTAVSRALSEAMSGPVDDADLFFEYTTHEQVMLEDGIVKKATKKVEQGLGARAISGTQTGYSFSEEITPDSVLGAAKMARQISRQGGSGLPVNLQGIGKPERDLYPVEEGAFDRTLQERIELLSEMDRIARDADPRIAQVIASLSIQRKTVMVARSDGFSVADDQPLVRLQIVCIAKDGSRSEQGVFGGGGRSDEGFFRQQNRYERYAKEAARQALVNLDAAPAPAGMMTVVLGPGWPGILLHEAVGHGLEADFNRKKLSAFSDRIGKKVATEHCTVVDDGTIPGRRGSLNVDDEGTPTGRTVLIENGVLKGYMQDKQNARLMGVEPTGNGRRESFAHAPMPRMTNTFMMPGESSPDDVLGSVKDGLYMVSFGGGQVDITNGKFVFSASEAYKIENGKITTPVKGATLVGDGPTVLTRVGMVANDLKLDEGIGTCGKNGQGVPVGVGLPTIRIDGITVGGTE